MARLGPITTALVIALSACTHRQNTSRPSTMIDTTPPSAAPSAATPKPNADDILQARLSEAVKELPETDATHEPEPPVTMIGLVPHSDAAAAPRIKLGSTKVSGRLPPEVVQRIVRQNSGRFRLCYEAGLTKNADLAGSVETHFTIDETGAVKNVKSSGSIPDAGVTRCVQAAFAALAFPQPERGRVTVSYPIVFTPGSAASANAAQSTPPAAPPPPAPALDPPPPEGPWPIVVIEGRDVLEAGKKIASLDAILEQNRLARVDGLFESLKAQREEWKKAHPHAAFPGVAGLRLAATTPLTAVKSVFQTMAFAGYPSLFLQLASEPKRIVELRAIVPGPPDSNQRAVPAPPPSVLRLHLHGDQAELTWKRGPTVESESHVSRTAPDFASKLCEEQKLRGSHHDPTDPFVDRLVVGGDNDLDFAALADVWRAVQSCQRPYGKKSVPAFWLSLSVR